MPTFTLSRGDEEYEVDAESPEAAYTAVFGGEQPKPKPSAALAHLSLMKIHTAAPSEYRDPNSFANQAAEFKHSTVNPSFMPTSRALEMGVTDPYYGGAQFVMHALPGVDASGIDKKIADREETYQAERKAAGKDGFDGWRTTGNFFGTAPLMLAAPAGGGLLATTGAGAAMGAGEGLLQPVTDRETLESGGYGAAKTKDTLLGAAVGGGTSFGFGLLGKAFRGADLTPNEQLLRNEGVQLTPGQAGGFAKLEEKAASITGLGDMISNTQRESIESFNKAVYNRVLKPIGAKYDGPVGNEGVRKVGDVLSDAYDALVPNLQLVPDQQFAADLSAAAGAKQVMSEQSAKQFDAILETMLPKGPLAGQSLKDLESKLAFEINRFGRSSDPSHQMIGDALADVRTAVMDNLARTNPDHAVKLKAIDEGWANLVRLERAALNGKQGVFTPEQFMSAIRNMETTVRRRGVARGTALMQDLGNAGVDVLGKQYPDSGSAGRALLGAAAMGGASPWLGPGPLAAGVAAAVPYLPGARRVVPNLLASRPGYARPIADAFGLLGPAAGVGGATLLGGP